MKYAPKTLLNIQLLAVGLLLGFVVYILTLPPYTGFMLGYDELADKFLVTSAEDWVQAQGLNIGDEVVSFSDQQGARILPGPGLFQTNRSDVYRYLPDPAQRIAAFDSMYQLFSRGEVTVNLSSGRELSLQFDHARRLQDYHARVWILLPLSILPLLITAAIWSWQPERPESGLLLLSALGFYLFNIESVVSLFYQEMFYLPWFLHWLLTAMRDSGQLLFASAGTAVLLYYPARLVSSHRTVKLIAGLSLSYYFGVLAYKYATGQHPDLSIYQTYPAMMLAVAVIAFLGIRQYKRSARMPVQRAQVQWIMLAWLVGPVIFIVLRVIPRLMGEEPVLSGSLIATPVILTTFLMVAIGIARINLFQVEQHISRAYHWVFISIGFLALDLILVSFVNLNTQLSSVIVVATVIWVYLPVRHWLENRFYAARKKSNQEQINAAVVLMINQSLDSRANPQMTWRSSLDKAFNPERISLCDTVEKSQLGGRGQSLMVPANQYSPALILEFASGGTRLFDSGDVQVLETLSLLFEKLFGVRDAYLVGEAQERDRIRRDLHDQIGHKLLSLIYAAKDDKSRMLAQETMSQLNELIRALKSKSIYLDDLVARIHKLAEEACAEAGLSIEFGNRSLEFGRLQINSDQYLNILNILRELLSNSIKHAAANGVRLETFCSGGCLEIEYSDDGVGFDHDLINPGNGLFNIQSRILELKAKIDWMTEAGTTVKLRIPLSSSTHSGSRDV